MKFLKKCNPDEYQDQVQRATEEENERYQERADRVDETKAHRAEKTREDDKLRQRRHREKKYDREISLGERTPGGTKRTREVCVRQFNGFLLRILTNLQHRMVHLEDAPTKRQKHSVAELSRPNRAQQERGRQEKKETQKKGRPRVHQARDAFYHNWFSPFLWRQILAAGTEVGWEMSPSAIRNWLQKKDPAVFAKISRTTISEWIDRSGSRPKWSEKALRLAENGNHQLHPEGGCRGALVSGPDTQVSIYFDQCTQASYPDVVEAITTRLERLREASAPVTLVTVRGIVVATILKMAPEIFEKRAKDGSTFRCSDSYLRNWLHGTLLWSERKATRAAQKLPDNWEHLCQRAFLRIAYGIKEQDIPPELFVNSDQTQVVYAQGSKLTWAKTGSRQVTVVGEDEKRAFTVVVSISNSGELLPFQAIYQGYTAKTCPSKSAKDYDAAKAAGFRFEFSKSKTYWSTHETMHDLVDEIIAPYFAKQKAKLGLPASQMSIWQIDVWSVHRSQAFRNWMKAKHSNIILDFVPGGTTGVWQACDVGIQRIFKHSLKRSYHEDVVAAILKQIDDGVDTIEVDKKLGILRDQSVSWMWKAYQTLNKPEIVKKVKSSYVVFTT
jgi:hypothetical protein